MNITPRSSINIEADIIKPIMGSDDDIDVDYYEEKLNSVDLEKSNYIEKLESFKTKKKLTYNEYGIIKKHNREFYNEYYDKSNKELSKTRELASYLEKRILNTDNKDKDYFTNCFRLVNKITSISKDIYDIELAIGEEISQRIYTKY